MKIRNYATLRRLDNPVAVSVTRKRPIVFIADQLRLNPLRVNCGSTGIKASQQGHLFMAFPNRNHVFSSKIEYFKGGFGKNLP
ncbi:MAG TPA: hypothetical protein VHC04_11625 [Rhodopila sp.]|jgi:hypothetical protein|nr:hypothetical protein [Rhodopila sp.]